MCDHDILWFFLEAQAWSLLEAFTFCETSVTETWMTCPSFPRRCFQLSFYFPPYSGKMNTFWCIVFRWVETWNQFLFFDFFPHSALFFQFATEDKAETSRRPVRHRDVVRIQGHNKHFLAVSSYLAMNMGKSPVFFCRKFHWLDRMASVNPQPIHRFILYML